MGAVQKIAFRMMILTVLVLGWSACRKGNELDCIRPVGKAEEEVREPGSFSTIGLYHDIDLVLTTDSVEKLRVVANKHILDGIRTEVENNILVIQDVNQCKWLHDTKRKITVYLTVTHDQLKSIDFHGAGKITCTNALQEYMLNVNAYGATGSASFNVEGYEVNCFLRNGASDLTFSGTVDRSFVYLGGVGFVMQNDLKTETTRVEQHGLGDVFVGTANTLKIGIYHQGSIFYQGDPFLASFNDEGEGELIRAK